jgi:hypothetical protein
MFHRSTRANCDYNTNPPCARAHDPSVTFFRFEALLRNVERMAKCNMLFCALFFFGVWFAGVCLRRDSGTLDLLAVLEKH